MKKFLIFALSLTLVFAMCISAVAESEQTVNIYVTISFKGTPVVFFEEIKVSDIDNDSALTINDVLIIAHEKFFDGENGYASAETEYGLSMIRLWGDESGCFGYYKNNNSALSLGDSVADGDSIYAYVYSDCETWSDSYSYFDFSNISASVNETTILTLTMCGYDENWNIVKTPVESATILINGEETNINTDAEGKAVIAFDSEGTYEISAKSETLTLVPPVCIANVVGVENESNSESEESSVEVSEEASEHSKPATPNTGDNSNISIFAIIALCSLLAVIKIKNN